MHRLVSVTSLVVARSALAAAVVGFAAAPVSAQDGAEADAEVAGDIADESSDLEEIASDPGENGSGSADDLLRLPDLSVTARRWSELLQDVPAAVTAVSGEEIEAARMRSLQDVSHVVPNVWFTQFSSRRLTFPYVRGVGSGQGDPAVLTYLDGVPQLSVSSTNLPLLGVERVEVLRGPQATLYGRNALGGLIHVHTRKPSLDGHSGHGRITIGNYDLREFELGYTGPLAEDHAGISVALMQSSREGFTENDLTGNDVDDRDAFFGRIRTLFRLADTTDLILAVHGERARDGGFVLGELIGLNTRPHHIAQDFEGESERDLYETSATLLHEFDGVDFTSITAFQGWQVDEHSDFDFSPFDLVRRRTREDQRQWSQELRLSSAAEDPVTLSDDASMRWQVGVLGFSNDRDFTPTNEFRVPLPGIPVPGFSRNEGAFHDDGLAGYGQATVTLYEQVDLTAGIRFDWERKRVRTGSQFSSGGFVLSQSSARFHDRFGEWVPAFSAAWRYRADQMTYVSLAKGYKAGGFNLAAPTGRIPFGPERSWTLEAGWKADLMEDRLAVRAAAFATRWDEMQLSLFDPIAGGFVDNAGEAKSRGVELELTARPAEGLTLIGGLGVLDTEFEEFIDSFGFDDDGNHLPNAPRRQWNIGVQYGGELSDDLGWFARADHISVGQFFYDPSNLQSERFSLTNLRVGIERGDQFSFDFFVHNLLDEEYVQLAFQADPSNPLFFVGENGAPRVIGFSGQARF